MIYTFRDFTIKPETLCRLYKHTGVSWKFEADLPLDLSFIDRALLFEILRLLDYNDPRPTMFKISCQEWEIHGYANPDKPIESRAIIYGHPLYGYRKLSFPIGNGLSLEDIQIFFTFLKDYPDFTKFLFRDEDKCYTTSMELALKVEEYRQHTKRGLEVDDMITLTNI